MPRRTLPRREVLDATKDDTQKEKLERELDICGIRLNQRPPNIAFQASVLDCFLDAVTERAKLFEMHLAMPLQGLPPRTWGDLGTDFVVQCTFGRRQASSE